MLRNKAPLLRNFRFSLGGWVLIGPPSYKHKQKLIIITDLLDISEFKISLQQDLIVIYIKYTIIKDRCNIYSRSISHNDRKLLINKYIVMSNFKPEMFDDYCTINSECSCFTRLLNEEKKTKKVDLIQNGSIL